MLSIIARILGVLVSCYSFCCFVRILLSWLPGLNLGRAGDFLARVTDPYLDFFEVHTPLRAGGFDFSPIIALALLSVLINIFEAISVVGTISIGYIVATVLRAAWSAVSFFLIFLAVAALIRVIAYAARANSTHPFWMTLDAMLNPVLFKINRLIYRNRIVNYLQGLVTALAVLVIICVAGGVAVDRLCRLLYTLPF